MQVIDYMNWAIQRVFVRGEMRYFNFVKDKVSFVWDVYDTSKYPKNFYSKANELDNKKNKPSIARWSPTHGMTPAFTIRRLEYQYTLK